MNEKALASSPVTQKQFFVSEIYIEELFGRYTYRISPLTANDAKRGAPPLMLLYGDNGSGKTTIMRILWNLFSPADNKGHRSELARTPFRTLRVRLGNGDVITVHKPEELIGSYNIEIARGRQKALIQPYFYESTLDKVLAPSSRNVQRSALSSLSKLEDVRAQMELFEEFASEANDDRYIDYLQELDIHPYLLADDRRMHSDEQSGLRHRRPRREPTPDNEASSVAAELQVALRRMTDWLRQQVFSAAQEGSQSADQIYREVLTQLTKVKNTDETYSIEAMSERILELDNRTKLFNEFELVPRMGSKQLLSILNRIDPQQRGMATSILAPYIEGQKARLDSLQSTERIVRIFVNSINKYLTDKVVVFTPSRGLVIEADGGTPLEPRQLSSGERQLLLLLCNALLARETTSLFLIDEPELSLNVKWQRNLVRTLLECTEGSGVQFILATHSIEIVTRHREYLAQLRKE